jgi:hypothetical protein
VSPKLPPSKDLIREVATSTLVSVSKDSKAPPAARAAAARTLLESIGDIGRLQSPTRQSEKPLNEMSKAEIDAEIERLRAKKDAKD